MQTYLIPMLLLLMVAPLAVRAEEPPPAQADETDASSAEDLPYGAGYEARQRLAQDEGQAGTRDQAQTQAQERTRAETRATPAETRSTQRDAARASSQRDARREAREHRTQRGPGGH